MFLAVLYNYVEIMFMFIQMGAVVAIRVEHGRHVIKI